MNIHPYVTQGGHARVSKPLASLLLWHKHTTIWIFAYVNDFQHFKQIGKCIFINSTSRSIH